MKDESNLRTRPAARAISEIKSVSVMTKQAKPEPNGNSAIEISIGTQVVMFATLALSVVASRFIDYYRAGLSWNPVQDWQYLLFALIVSFMAYPLVYRKMQKSRNDPILVQLGLIFTAGIG